MLYGLKLNGFEIFFFLKLLRKQVRPVTPVRNRQVILDICTVGEDWRTKGKEERREVGTVGGGNEVRAGERGQVLYQVFFPHYFPQLNSLTY